jgi:hypothetical protein
MIIDSGPSEAFPVLDLSGIGGVIGEDSFLGDLKR